MKIKLLQALIAAYFLLVFVFLKAYSIFSVAFFIIAVLVDNYSNIKSGLKNLIYLMAAFSVFMPLFSIFLIYIPFMAFGLLLKERSFVRDYVLGFAVSFIPAIAIYLISTYLSIPLNYAAIAIIFYLLPATAIILTRKKCISIFEIGLKESVFFLMLLFFTALIAVNIIDNTNLFVANSAREFYRIQTVVDGLEETSLIPIYDPNIGTGEATYLWVPASFAVHFGLAELLLKFMPPILFFNAHTVFILLLSALSIGVLFFSIISWKKTTLNVLAVTAAAALTGLNFYFLQLLESIKAFYAYPIAYLFLSIIMDNPKTFREYAILMYISALIVTIHPAYGVGMVILGASLFFSRKAYYLREKDELKQFAAWSGKNKLKLSAAVMLVLLLPLFYVSTSFTYKDFLADNPRDKHGFGAIKSDSINFFKGTFGNEFRYLSLKYPDISRIDDHKFGFFISVFGMLSLFLLIILYKIKDAKNFRTFLVAYIINLFIISFIGGAISLRVGGFYRIVGPYILILLGASLITLISISNKKYLKSILVAIAFAGFILTIPHASRHISGIHQEQFMSGSIYPGELELLKQLPKDGRIMTYGLFSNVIDYGISYFTGRYASRSERIELAIDRSIFERIHGQNSFGEPEQVLAKSGTELSNYLRLGGYKYVFLNAQHPIGNYVTSQIYPGFSYAIYQNGPLIFFAVNGTSYAEKVDLVEHLDEEIYKTPGGYKYSAISPYYGFEAGSIDYSNEPKEPEPLQFERPAPTEATIRGNFSNGEWVVFKEQYFPRWKAYMDGKEIPVYANNFDQILIRTIEGDSIKLEYSVPGIEKIFGFLSIIGVIGLSIIFIILLRKS